MLNREIDVGAQDFDLRLPFLVVDSEGTQFIDVETQARKYFDELSLGVILVALQALGEP